MEFNKNKVFTALTADMMRAGSRGFFEDSMFLLRDTVETSSENDGIYDTIVMYKHCEEI